MDKLQELTQKLYNEGLAKGKEEGEALLAKATAQAEEIVKQAQAQAAAIVEKAQKEAQDYKVKMEGDVKMASTQALQATKAGIEGLIVAKAVEPVKEQLSGAAFLKEICHLFRFRHAQVVFYHFAQQVEHPYRVQVIGERGTG